MEFGKVGAPIMAIVIFFGHDRFNYTIEDHDWATRPETHPWRHFRNLSAVEQGLANTISNCNADDFGRFLHQGQDYFSH